MAIIKKKTWPEQFEAIMSGKKKFDLRLNEFEAKEGDTLVLEEYNPDSGQYTGRKLEKRISYVFKFTTSQLWWPEEEVKAKGLQILSLE